MRRGEVHIGGFRCPGCGEDLEANTPFALPVALISIPLGVWIASHIALSGYTFVLVAFIGTLLISCAAGFVTGWFRPTLVRKPPTYGVDFRITGPPDPPKKE
jgi:hypothetical protein